MQCFYSFRVGGDNFQQSPGRASGAGAVLLPVLQGAQVDADESGELTLADMSGLADLACIGGMQLGHHRAAHALASDVALHLADALDQLVEMLLIHG